MGGAHIRYCPHPHQDAQHHGMTAVRIHPFFDKPDRGMGYTAKVQICLAQTEQFKVISDKN